MPNIAESLNLLSIAGASKKQVAVIQCVKTPKDLNIKASSSKEFFFVRMPLDKISLSASTKIDRDTVVIDKNVLKIGRTASGFIPKVTILCGHNVVMQAKAEKQSFINIWAGLDVIKKLNIMADDAISSNELQSKLSVLVSKNFKSQQSNGSTCCDYPSSAWIREIYPFENYLIFDWKGDTYKQAYVLDPVTREVALAGKPTKVFQEYEEVPKGLNTAQGKKAEIAEQIIQSAAALPVIPSGRSLTYYTNTMSQEQDFDPINSQDKPLGMLPGSGGEVDSTTYGAPSSEYAQTPLKSMTNIEEALQLYLTAIAQGTHVVMPSVIFSNAIVKAKYPNEYSECSIAAKESGEAVNIPDFLLWQTKQLNSSKKLKNGKSITEFSAVGDPDDISTWSNVEVSARKFSNEKRQKMAKEGTAKPDGSYPISNAKDVSNAVKDFHRANGSPSDKAHIRKRAKVLGLGDPFEGKDVESDAADNQLPGGYRPPPSMSGKGKKVKADAEIAQGMVAGKKKHKLKADMNMPMPSGAPVAQTSQNSMSSSFQPNAGRKKFKIGDKVTTKHGRGRISDDEASKDHVEVTHYKTGKVAILHKNDVQKAGK